MLITRYKVRANNNFISLSVTFLAFVQAVKKMLCSFTCQLVSVWKLLCKSLGFVKLSLWQARNYGNRLSLVKLGNKLFTSDLSFASPQFLSQVPASNSR